MNNSSSIAVSTGFQEVNLSPGQTYEGEFFVLNPSSEQSLLNYTIAIAPLSFENDSYEVYFDYPMDYNQITDWIQIENPSGSVERGGRNLIKYTIEVPENAPAGGQYAAFLVRLESEDSEQALGYSVKNNSQVAVMLYASIDGETRKTGIVEKNSISPIYLDSPIKTETILNNTGNVHMKASVVLKVFPLFSDEEVYSNEEKPDEKIIIPGTSQYSERKWEGTPRLGLYKITQEVEFAGNKEIKEQIALVCPIWFLVLSIAFVLACIFYLIDRGRKRKKT